MMTTEQKHVAALSYLEQREATIYAMGIELADINVLYGIEAEHSRAYAEALKGVLESLYDRAFADATRIHAQHGRKS
jgi:hypothetical protein